jgi:C-terminal processing protease CtpA/Prc
MVPQVTLAGANFTEVPAILSDSGNNKDPEQMANVGIGLLKQFKVDLDLGRDRIYLTPRTDKPAFDRDRSGARFTFGGDRLKAAFVSPDGPAAAAGLKPGEEIVAVNGRAITPAYYRGSDWTRGPAGEKVVLSRADGSKVTVTLADYY